MWDTGSPVFSPMFPVVFLSTTQQLISSEQAFT